jgi:predicted phosphodiesterase
MRLHRAVLGIVVLAAIAGLRHRQRQPGSGDDDLDGGSGHDAVDYVANPTGVDVDLAIAGPQLKGSGADTFAGIEDVYGTRERDVLRGDRGSNQLVGFEGDDTISGRVGAQAGGVPGAFIPSVRVAALYDVHGNVPALDAVLDDVDRAGVDAIVWGGDVAFGPLPVQTIARMRERGGRCVMGNCDREMVRDFDASDDEHPWVRALGRAERDFLAAFEPTVTLDVDGLGPTLFCHGSPRRDEERITRATPQERLAPMLAGVAEHVVVCGHTHQQFDVRCGEHRVLNAGSVGLPYEGVAAAFWLLLGPDVELRRTDYEVAAVIEGLSDDDRELLKESLIEPADPDWVTRYFETGEE